jgi:hypothetical protein
MDKIQLIHPEGKKAISMDRKKYNALRELLLYNLQTKGNASFKEMLAGTENQLKQRKIKLEGKLEWNLFWVSLDLEARKEINRDKSVSPHQYRLETR